MSGEPPRILKKGSLEAAAARGGAGLLEVGAQERGREIVAAARAEAEALLARAAVEAAELRAVAAAEGEAEGRAQAAALLARAAEVREARLSELDGTVVDVAIEIARRLVGRELAVAPGAVADVARRALRAASGAGDVVLRVAPADLAAIRGEADALRALVERGELTLAEDPTLTRGEVVVEGSGGRVDARIEAQLEAFRRALRAGEP